MENNEEIKLDGSEEINLDVSIIPSPTRISFDLNYYDVEIKTENNMLIITWKNKG